MSGLTDALDECDLLLVSTGAPDVLVERGAIEAAMERRNGRALLIVDIGVPRNVDPGAGEVFGVDLLDIDDLHAVGEHSMAQRRQEVGKVRDVIAEELERYRVEKSAREAAPLVTALRRTPRRSASASSTGRGHGSATSRRKRGNHSTR